jgi:hypothetical protein
MANQRCPGHDPLHHTATLERLRSLSNVKTTVDPVRIEIDGET